MNNEEEFLIDIKEQKHLKYIESKRVLGLLPSGKVSQLYKTTRAGATTGICSVAVDSGLNVVLISPTIQIATKTLEESMEFTKTNPNIYNIPGNHVCMKIHEMIDEFPDLEMLPIIPLPEKCNKCSYNNICQLTKFINAENPSVVGLTHAKIQALIYSKSNMNQDILEKLIGVGNLFIIDEAHNLESLNAETIQIYPHINTNKYLSLFLDSYKNVDLELVDENTKIGLRYNTIIKFVNLFNKILKHNNSEIHQLMTQGELSNRNLMMTQIKYIGDKIKMEKIPFDQTRKAIAELIHLMKYRKNYYLEVSDIVELSNIVMVLSGGNLVMHYMKVNKGNCIYLSSPGMLRNAFKELTKLIFENKNKGVVITSATFGDFDYESIFGDIFKTKMLDRNFMNCKMTIVPDTIRLSTENYWRNNNNNRGKDYKQYIINNIIEYNKKYPGIKILCMTKKVSVQINRWFKELGILIRVDYYRSSDTIGVSCKDRQLVVVGEPVSPINSNDGISESYEESQKIRIGNNHAAFAQAIARVKDPNGKDNSLVICLGIKETEIRQMMTWGIDRELIMDGTECVDVITNDPFEMVNIKHVELTKEEMLFEILKNQNLSQRDLYKALKLRLDVFLGFIKNPIFKNKIGCFVINYKTMYGLTDEYGLINR